MTDGRTVSFFIFFQKVLEKTQTSRFTAKPIVFFLLQEHRLTSPRVLLQQVKQSQLFMKLHILLQNLGERVFGTIDKFEPKKDRYFLFFTFISAYYSLIDLILIDCAVSPRIFLARTRSR
jgi:hypothetical protein